MPYDLANGLLPFPLNNLASDGGVVALPFVVGDESQANDGENFYVLCMDADDFTDLLSVVAVGAPIALPDGYNKIIQQINQLRQFPNQIPEGSCMDLCQLILDCINDTPALQQAIAQYSIASSIASDAPEVQENLDIQLVDDPFECDDDIIFGMTTGLTDLLNTVAEDVIQIFSNASGISGRIGDMIEAIPGIGVLPVDDIFQFVESFMTDMDDAYLGAYTSQIRDDIRCDLFCLAQANGCVLTLEIARDYFAGKLGESITFDFWDGFIDDLISNFYSGEPAVWAMHLMIVETIIFGGELVGFDVNRLATTIQALHNDPDSDWSIVCSDCVWESFLDFTVIDPMTLICGAWVDGVGYIAADCASDRKVNANLSFDSSTVTSIEWDADVDIDDAFSPTSRLAAKITYKNVGSTVVATETQWLYSDILLDPFNLDNLKDGFIETANELELFVRCGNTTHTGSGTIRSVTLKGTGIKPSQLP